MTVSFSFNLHPCKPQCSPSVLSHFGPMQSGITLCYFLTIETQKQSHGICFFVPVNTFTQSTQSRKQGPLQLSPEGATPSLASGMGYRCTLYLTILPQQQKAFPMAVYHCTHCCSWLGHEFTGQIMHACIISAYILPAAGSGRDCLGQSSLQCLSLLLKGKKQVCGP